MARKRKAEAGEDPSKDYTGSLRWLLTYADCITLLLAVFIIAAMISTPEAKKFEKMMEGFQKVFGKEKSILDKGKGILSGQKDSSLIEHFTPVIGMREKIDAFKEGVEQEVKEMGLEGVVVTRITERGIEIILQTEGEQPLFDLGKAEIRDNFKPFLNTLSDKLKGVSNDVRVEGHTCDIPISTSAFPTNWELSTRRATNVLRYLISQGISSQRLQAAGYADTKPIIPPGAPDHVKEKYKNRRVSITILFPEKVEEKLQPKVAEKGG